MKVRDFLLERYFAKYEFSVRYLLSPSDCESMSVEELLAGCDSETAALWKGLRLSYTESRGLPDLRDEIGRAAGLSGEEAMVLNPEEGIFLTMNALLDEKDHVIVLSPAYQSLYEIPKSLGCEVTRWYLKREDGKWFLDLPALKDAIRDNTSLIVINFPHNPTGFLPSEKEFMEVVDLASKKGIFLFSDEMYRGLESDPSKRLPVVSALYKKSASLGGLSKAYGLPGLRIGWLTSRDGNFLDHVASLKDYTSVCPPAPSEVLAVAALRQGAKLVQRCRDIVEGNLALAKGFFQNRKKDFEWYEPGGGSTAFPKLLGGRPVREFCDSVVKEKGLMVLPDFVFDVDWNHFRLGLGREDLPKALELLGEYIDKYH